MEGAFIDKLHSKGGKVRFLVNAFLLTVRQAPRIRAAGKPHPVRYLLEDWSQLRVGNGI